jgi:mono/diheme cytochrome c family protein
MMRIFLKGLKILSVLIVSAALFGLIYLKVAFPKVGPPQDIHITASPEKLERGRYLVSSVATCFHCHGTRDWTKYTGPLIPGTEGKGGQRFDESMGLPGVIYTRNITPAGIGKWTDGEVLRAFSSGLNNKGEPLFPLMPYNHFGKMTQEDAESIIVYLRTLTPISFEVPDHVLKFPLNLLLPTLPTPAQFATKIDKSNSVEYGAYLANISNCITCHTQDQHGLLIAGMEFAGGRRFLISGGITRSANLTPDKETGIGIWDKADFIDSFRSVKLTPVAEGEKNTIMPRSEFNGMTDEDLGAIYDFLRTQKPVYNKVEHFTKGEKF